MICENVFYYKLYYIFNSDIFQNAMEPSQKKIYFALLAFSYFMPFLTSSKPGLQNPHVKLWPGKLGLPYKNTTKRAGENLQLCLLKNVPFEK